MAVIEMHHVHSVAMLAEPQEYRVEPIPGEVSSPTSQEIQVSRRQGLTGEQAAVWIRVLLRLEREMPMARLAERLGFSDHLFGTGLARLIREGTARIRNSPDGLRVFRVESARR